MPRSILIFGLLATALAAQTTHKVTLTWLDTANPTGTTYSVYRATGLCSGAPVYSKIATALTAKTFDDTTVTPGNYCYTVSAVAGGAESAYSTSAPAPVLPFPPTGLSVVVQ